ncbi:MAG: hypothetical protein RL398_3090 [Planctomycetota bacterium]
MRALIACLWLVAALLGQSPGGPQPNVLVIVADDLGVDSIGCYQEGTDLPSTPNLDALAARGVLFRNAYAYASCSPTRAALLTGRHPARTLVGRHITYHNNTNPRIGTLRAEEHTLPEVLQRANLGYAHAAIGKWHLHDATQGPDAPRQLGGFAHFAGTLGNDVGNYFGWPRTVDGSTATCTNYATQQVTDDALAWIGTQTGPWLCYLAYQAPHAPFHVPPAGTFTRTLGSPPTMRDKYLAMVEAMDYELGRLFATLGQATLANTYVVFLGDNGTPQGIAVPPFLPNKAKTTPYEGGIRVPMLVAGPGVAVPGRTSDALVCAVDVFATALDVTQSTTALPPWLVIDGVSMAPYLQNPQQPPLRTYAFAEEFTGNEWPAPAQNGNTVVRNDRYKLIHRMGGLVEMFDLQNDPREQFDLLATGPLSAPVQQNFIALVVERNRMRTPTAAWMPFGTGCSGAVGMPTTTCGAPPRFGSTMPIQLGNAAPHAFAVLALGFDASMQGATPLPMSLLPFGGGNGCNQWFRMDAVYATLADATGSASIGLTVPNLPQLMEWPLYGGWFVFDLFAPPGTHRLTTARPIVGTLGY